MKQRSHRRTRMLGAGWDTLPARPLRTTRVLHIGIERRPRERTAAELPPSDRHAQILELLGDEPTGATQLAKATGLTHPSVTASLYALADRGLAERVPWKGWRRAGAAE